MASKKYLLTLTLAFVSAMTFAQAKLSDASSPWNDSSKVSTNKMPQFNQFMRNEYPYPAKPRNMWEIGLNVGHAWIVSDVPLFTGASDSRHGRYNGGVNVGLSARKAISHVFSVRPSFEYSSVHIPWYLNNGKLGMTKDNTFSLSGDLIASLNSISHYRGNPKGDFYVLGGYSIVYSVDAYTVGGQASPFPTNALSGSISTKVSGNKAKVWTHALDLGIGYSFKLNDRWNLGLEEKLMIPVPGIDYLEGIPGGNSNDLINYFTIRINYNAGNKAKRVQPLWWLNPNNYVYNELNVPKHMKIPPAVLPDGDGDGVPDQFDLEPNTPAGAQVDTHGRALDTDGDGVPDYRDKEKLTPQNCFPVDKDGVGTCPEPACCKELRDKIANLNTAPKAPECTLGSLPSIQFKAGSAKLNRATTNLLDNAAAAIKANPACKVKVIGHPAASKIAQQLAFDRVDAVVKYLTTKQGIAEDRFINSYNSGAGDANTIDLLSTTEEGPNNVVAPFPQYRTRH